MVTKMKMTAALLPAAPLLTTAQAAEVLGLRPQTLRLWACRETGPLRPVRLGRRTLRWRADEIARLMGVDGGGK